MQSYQDRNKVLEPYLPLSNHQSLLGEQVLKTDGLSAQSIVQEEVARGTTLTIAAGMDIFASGVFWRDWDWI